MFIYKKLSLIIFFFLLTAIPALAEEGVRDYTVDIRINPDASVDVVERITYDFGSEERHGIFREIPYEYKARGGDYSLRIDKVSVTDSAGSAIPFNTDKKNGNYLITIGDPNQTISGQHTYALGYTVRRTINYFEAHDEFYWNAISGWEVPIDQTRVNVKLPASISEGDIKAECFAGSAGAGRNCVSKRYDYAAEGAVSDIVFIHDRLVSGDGLTIVVGLGKGNIAQPSFLAASAGFAKDNSIILLPFLAGAAMFFWWRKKGRDPMGKQTIIAQYSPLPGLCPSEIGTILDERTHRRDVSSDIVYLATLGYLKIRRLEEKGLMRSKADYEIVKLKEADASLARPCRELHRSLFKEKTEIKISALKDKFYKDLGAITRAVYQSTVDNGYFKTSPEKIRTRWGVLAITFFFASWFIGPIFGPVGAVSTALTAILIFVFGLAMPARTEKGVLAREHIMGLKDYLRVAEKDRLDFHNAPEKSPRHFEALLPFAMALSVETAWAGQFKGIYEQAPDWYEDATNHTFDPLVLADSLGGFNRTADAALSSRPSSAASHGSGFSGGHVGGGFGGGRGGSW